MTRYFALILAFIAAPALSDESIVLRCDYKKVSKGDDIIKNGREYTQYYKIVSGESVYGFDMDKGSWSRYYYVEDFLGKDYVDVSAGAIEFGEYTDSNAFIKIRIDRRTAEYTKSVTYRTPVSRYKGNCTPSDEPTLSKPKF